MKKEHVFIELFTFLLYLPPENTMRYVFSVLWRFRYKGSDCQKKYTVVVAQLVRAPDCGSGGRGFETHLPPRKIKASLYGEAFFVRESFSVYDYQKNRARIKPISLDADYKTIRRLIVFTSVFHTEKEKKLHFMVRLFLCVKVFQFMITKKTERG